MLAIGIQDSEPWPSFDSFKDREWGDQPKKKNAICLKKAEKTMKWSLSRDPRKNKDPQTP